MRVVSGKFFELRIVYRSLIRHRSTREVDIVLVYFSFVLADKE